MRERIMLPLTTIQQYALINLQNSKQNGNNTISNEGYQKMIVRCSFGIINAGRNSA
jgi:phosphoenolpyruvate carboxylase